MNKKNRPENANVRKSVEKLPDIMVGSGIGLLVIGFIVLSMVDRMAENWAGVASPILLVSGWLVIACGLWRGENER
jgi:hypothetical protein